MSNKEFIKQVRMKFFGYAIGDIIRSTRGGSLMGAFIQCFCFIGYMSEIVSIKNSEKNLKNHILYQNFVKKYLSNYDSKKLYAIRCALVHTYGHAKAMKSAKLSGYSFQHKNPENNRKYEDNIYHLNLSNFIFDIVKASYIFFNDLEKKNEDELFDYRQRIKAMLTVNDQNGSRISSNYAEVDKILSAMDAEKIDWKIVEDNIYQLCLDN